VNVGDQNGRIVTNILFLSPKHSVFNIRHQHRYCQVEIKNLDSTSFENIILDFNIFHLDISVYSREFSRIFENFCEFPECILELCFGTCGGAYYLISSYLSPRVYQRPEV